MDKFFKKLDIQNPGSEESEKSEEHNRGNG